MKKISILFLFLFSEFALAMQQQPQQIVTGSIAVMPFRPLYVGNAKIGFGTIDLQKTFNQTIAPGDLLQEVIAWNGIDTRYDYNNHYNDFQLKRPFPQYVPRKLLESLKEGHLLKINADGINYELICNQSGLKNEKPTYSQTDKFEQALIDLKKIFDKEPSWLLGDEEYLLNNGILKELPSGNIVHSTPDKMTVTVYQTFGLLALSGFIWYLSPASYYDYLKNILGYFGRTRIEN